MHQYFEIGLNIFSAVYSTVKLVTFFQSNVDENVTTGDVDRGDSEDDDDDSDDDGFKITIDHDKIDEAKTTYQVFELVF